MDASSNMKWNCYKKFYIPSTAPHEIVDTTDIKNDSIWKDKRGFAARWTSNFDIKQKTDWWYIIKDSPFSIDEIKAKRRYEINKGIKNFEVRIVNPEEYREELYDVFQRSMLGYPKEYRTTNNKKAFFKFIDNVSQNKNIQLIYGAFFKETQQLCGYLHIPTYKDWAALSSMKTDPEYEKYGINAAIIYQILLDYNERLSGKYYICDGQRNISHKTNFQKYLEKYFLFRKAYCKLNIKYSLVFKIVIKIAYPFRKIFEKFDFIKTIHSINSLLKMEECAKNCKRVSISQNET